MLEPVQTATSGSFAQEFESALETDFELTDHALAKAGFGAFDFDSPYNLTAVEAMNLGAAIGSNFLILIRADVHRRNSFAKKEYFEAYAALYLVESRTGLLVFWTLESTDAATPDAAAKKLVDRTKELAVKTKEAINKSRTASPGRKTSTAETETSDGTRFPLPYRRIKPKYTSAADIYGVEATVDIEVEIDAEGNVTDTKIVRWAGFGLDESVDETVRGMQWRPADRKGTPFTMRVLLRYNFKDIDNPDS